MSSAVATAPLEHPAALARAPLRLLGPPLLAFVAAQGTLWIAARAAGYAFFKVVTWSRFDSGYYISIAQAGYSVAPCGPARPPGTWCGNSGWFPGYPLLTSFFVQVGASARPAALFVSLGCCLAMLTLLWVGLLGAEGSLRNWLALGLAAFAPGQVYYHSIFPLALAGLALMAAIFFLSRDRWLAAGGAGAVLAATYPSGSLLAPVMAVWLLFRRDGSSLGTRVWRIVQTSGVAGLGAVFVLVIQRVQTTYWDAFFKVHAHYDNHFHDPVPKLVSLLTPLLHEAPTVHNIPRYEALFAAVLVLTLCGVVVARRKTAEPLDWLLVLTLLAFWIVPLSISHMDLYRSDALLIPAALLVRRAPIPIGVVAVACGAVLAVPMGEAFLVKVLG